MAKPCRYSSFFFLITPMIFLFSGCSTLPSGISIPDAEQVHAENVFRDFIAEMQGCLLPVDADITVEFNHLLYHGRIEGYLKALSPAYLRFDGVNPLGLTETILATDGVDFTMLSVREQLAYSGSVSAEKFKKYAPDAIINDVIFWLNGLVPLTIANTIDNVRRHESGEGYWLSYSENNSRKQVHFNDTKEQIEQIILIPQSNKKPVTMSYKYKTVKSPEGCSAPEVITIESKSGVISASFSKRYPDSPINDEHFRVEIPANYKKVSVQ